MKDIYKNPMFYYVLVPALAALWPALIWGVYLPASRASIREEMDQFAKTEQLIEELLAIDPERLNFTKEKDTASGFDYATAVQQTAELCSVPAGNYRLSSGIITKSEGQKNQSATVSLKGVEIIKAARFLSTIQLRWSGLQCTKAALKKNKGVPDDWNVDFTFKYYY